jgi:hypothetical protein
MSKDQSRRAVLAGIATTPSLAAPAGNACPALNSDTTALRADPSWPARVILALGPPHGGFFFQPNEWG